MFLLRFSTGITQGAYTMNFFADHFFACCGSVPQDVKICHNAPTYYGIQYNHSGKFFLSVNRGKPVIAEGPCVFITHPGAYFEYGCIDNVPRYHNWICSYGARIDRYIQSGLLILNTKPSIVQIKNPEKFLQTMLAVITMANQSVVPPRAILLYEDLLLQIYESRQKTKKLPPFQQKLLKNLIEAIREHPEREWDFREEADACHVTLAHFRRLFHLMTRMPPNQFLIQCRLQKAADLLITTNDSISDIAELIGLGSPFYFSRLFKKKFFSSPLEYRREFQGY